jgi:hypothetical protein
MSQSRKRRQSPKHILALRDLEQSKAAVLNSLTSKSGQRSYDRAITDFVDWYCSEPRLSFNRTVVLRYRIFLEQKRYAPTTINLRLAAVRRVAFEAADSGLLSPELAVGIRRVKGVRRIGVRLGNWLTVEQGKLADRGTGETAAREDRKRVIAGYKELRNPRHADRMRPQTRRATFPASGFDSVPRGTLGYRRSTGQGWPYPNRPHPGMGENWR